MRQTRQPDRANAPATRRVARPALALAAAAALVVGGWACDRDPAVTPQDAPDSAQSSAAPADRSGGDRQGLAGVGPSTPLRPSDRVASAGPSLTPAASGPTDGALVSPGADGLTVPTPAAPEALPPVGPPASFFVVDREPIRFPAARVAIRPAGDGAYLVKLFSDDPPEAMDAGYAGHSFYFEMRVTVPPGGTIADGEWSVQSASVAADRLPDDGPPADPAPPADADGEPAKSGDRPAGRKLVGVASGKPDADASGLFLDGRRRILVPVDAAAVFDPVAPDGTPDPALLSDAGRVRVRLVGTFRQWVEGEPADAAPRLVDVSATLSAARGR